MKKKTKIISAAIISGLLLGAAAGIYNSQGPEKDVSYCESLESNIAENKSFQGTVDCFSPGEVETDLPERVNESAELKCVCRKSFNGSVSWMNVAISN